MYQHKQASGLFSFRDGAIVVWSDDLERLVSTAEGCRAARGALLSQPEAFVSEHSLSLEELEKN